MREIMYDHNSILIVAILFIVLLLATEGGYRLGLFFTKSTVEATKNHNSAIQGSMLGVLALLLGFTFSLSLQRFDSRSEAVVTEANAIGTTILRADLLPETVRDSTQELLDRYVDLRIRAGTISMDRYGERGDVLQQSGDVLDALWDLAVSASMENPNPATTGLYVQALNQMIDAYGARDAELERHVPEPVLFLMFLAFVMMSLLIGYAAGVSGHRATFATYMLLVLVSCMIFIVIDLDRPRRGLIEVSQQSLNDLQVE
jgi:hypothetical protein